MGKKHKNIEIKRRQIGKAKEEPVEVISEKDGKKHKGTLKTFTEAEMEDLHLRKICPFYYFSEDSNKVLMIPFSLKMSVEEFLRQTAAQAVNFEKVIAEVNEAAKVRAKAQRRLARKGKK
jgi:hypothetical protein